MKNFPRTFALAGTFLALAGCAAATPAVASETATHNTPSVIGGTQASNPWAVQLKFQNYGSQGTFACTGEQLNAEWILTAKHCVEDAVAMNVYQSNNQLYPGTPIAVDRVHEAPTGDIALVHLSKPSPLPRYAQLDLNYSIKPGDIGTIMGYGVGAYNRPTTTLRAATVRVNGASHDAYYGKAVHLTGINGAANSGDSGGPLIINGKVVAVCSTGDAYPGGNIRASSNYALLGPVADWITETTGVGATSSTPEPDTEFLPIGWDNWGTWATTH